jgi:hypothetical protein
VHFVVALFHSKPAVHVQSKPLAPTSTQLLLTAAVMLLQGLLVHAVAGSAESRNHTQLQHINAE